MPDIIVLDGYTLNPGDNSWDPVRRYGRVTVYERTPEDEIVTRASGAPIVLTNKTPLDRKTLDQLPDLEFVGVLATGFDVVDIEAARELGVAVTNVPEYGTDAVAQHTFSLLLELTNHVALHDRAVRDGEWQTRGDFSFWKQPVVELAGKALGIVGLGRIGRRVAEIGCALGMRMVAASRTESDPLPWPDFSWVDLDDLFATADVVSLHCPLDDDTERMVDKERLESMKEDALLINTARGQLVDAQALAGALDAGELAGAAVDVVDEEPIPDDHPLLEAPRCLITPHMAWASVEARHRLMQTTADNIEAYLNGSPQNVVNDG